MAGNPWHVEREEHGRLLDGFFAMTGKPLELFVEGYSRRTVFTRPGEEKRPPVGESTLNAGLHTYACRHQIGLAGVGSFPRFG